MADKSTTDTGNDQGSSDIRDESLLEQGNDQSADEQQDTGSSDEQSQDSANGSEEPAEQQTTQKTSSDDDDGLAKFAKAQGFDPDKLTDGEKRALKLARDNQKAFHEARGGKEQLDEAIDTVYDPKAAGENEGMDEYERRELERDTRLARIEAKSELDAYYRQDPDASKYAKEAGEILLEVSKEQGQQAASVLARNKKYLFTLARDRAGVFNSDAARETGRREERESLRKKQEASADAGHATQPGTSTTPKVTRDWVENEYDPSNPEHRKMVDEAMASGALY